MGNISDNIFQDKMLQGNSSKWANWMSQLSLFTCKYCVENHGKIVDIGILENKYEVEAHPRCKCVYIQMRTKLAGTATDNGENGADEYLLKFMKLPDYYITKGDARKAGWINRKGNLADILPGKMIGGNVFENREKKLPDSNNRIWYEADINYTEGFRNIHRILYSNDGLIFVSYDHYQTFYEIIE